MAVWIQQLLAVMLAMNVQQLPSQLPKLDTVSGRPFTRQVLRPSPEFPLEHQFLFHPPEPVVFHPFQGQRSGKNSVNHRRFCAGPDQLPAGPLPQNSADGVYND